MSGVKHTPGPWRIVRTDGKGHEAPDGEAFWVQAGGYGWVGDSYLSSCIGQTDSAEANARLIASAPDLLEAAEEFCRRVEAGEIRSKRSYAAFKAAIARARGEQDGGGE